MQTTITKTTQFWLAQLLSKQILPQKMTKVEKFCNFAKYILQSKSFVRIIKPDFIKELFLCRMLIKYWTT